MRGTNSSSFSTKHQNSQMWGTLLKILQIDHTNDSNHNIKRPAHFSANETHFLIWDKDLNYEYPSKQPKRSR